MRSDPITQLQEAGEGGGGGVKQGELEEKKKNKLELP
jgi:hypothetical protein